MIPEAVLNQIQDRVDLVEVVSETVPLKRTGRNFKACCPFHSEKTPSFIVNPDKQIFHCFGCGVGGNVFSFLMKQEKRDFREVVEILAERVGVEIPKDKFSSSLSTEKNALLAKVNALALDFYHRYLLKDKEAQKARDYLEKRGIGKDAFLEFKLGYAPSSWDALRRALGGIAPDSVLEEAGLVISKKDGGFYDRFRDRIIFPILDSKGICLAFGARVLDDSLPKYLNSPETEIYTKGRHLYGFFQARKAIHETDSVIMVEGYMDLIACHQAGVPNVVASLGTALTHDQARLVKRNTRNVIILYDADKAGELATLRGLEIFLEEGLEVKILRPAKGHDPDSFIRAQGAAAFKKGVEEETQSPFDYRLALLKEKFDARSVEGKVKIAGEMVALFSKVQNEILKSAWTKELARELSLSEEALFLEIKKSKESARGPRPDVRPMAGSELRPVEKLLIGLMLEDPAFVMRAREELKAGDFQHPAARKVVQRIWDTRESLSAARMVNFYKDDPEAVQVISVASAETDKVLDKARTFSDCLLWVRRLRIHQDREGLRSELLLAEQQGNKNRIGQLLYDLNELNKGIKKINEKK